MTTDLIPQPGSPEWQAIRATGLGASEAAAACGLSRYATPLHIYSRKRGLISEIEDNDAMRMGRRLEPVVIAEFVDRTGEEIAAAPVATGRHEKHGCILATPDAQLVSGSLLECKTTTWRTAAELGDEGSDYIPVEWLMQCQQQLAVFKMDLCHLAVLLDGRTLRTYKIERNDVLIGRMLVMELELWERIEQGRAPEPDFKHEATYDLIRAIHKVEAGKTIDLDPDLVKIWQRDRKLAKIETKVEKLRKELRAQVLHGMGDAAIARLPGGEKEVVRKSIDATLVEAYTKKSYVTLTERKVKE